MGQLKPGATLIYERQGGTVYAREFGAPANERVVVGYDWKLDTNPARVRGATHETVKDNQLWHEIRVAAMENPALQDLLDRAKLLYHLGKEKNDSET
jgi:hypothetical protein